MTTTGINPLYNQNRFLFINRGITINPAKRINRCRPGYGASCSFCCGSHNYTLTPEEIGEIFSKRGSISERITLQHPENSSEEKLVKEGMQCPHIGFSDDEPGILCCLIYKEDITGTCAESFFNGTCKQFFCSAWDELTDREVLFAAGLSRDWYLYSLLINSPEILKNLYAEYSSPEFITEDILAELRIELTERLHQEDIL